MTSFIKRTHEIRGKVQQHGEKSYQEGERTGQPCPTGREVVEKKAGAGKGVRKKGGGSRKEIRLVKRNVETERKCSSKKKKKKSRKKTI